MNNEEQLLLTYLNRYYLIQNYSFRDIESDSIEYGSKILERLITTFSLSEEICEKVLIDWGLLGNMTMRQIKTAWDRPTLFPQYEPKRINRFLIEFPEELNLSSWAIKSASRPSMYFEIKKFLGIIYSKKIKWKPITFVFNDPIGPSTSQSLMTSLRERIEKPFDVIIEMLDPTGVIIEQWSVKKCFIESIDFGNLSMGGDDDIATCMMTVRFDDAILNY